MSQRLRETSADCRQFFGFKISYRSALAAHPLQFAAGEIKMAHLFKIMVLSGKPVHRYKPLNRKMHIQFFSEIDRRKNLIDKVKRSREKTELMTGCNSISIFILQFTDIRARLC